MSPVIRVLSKLANRRDLWRHPLKALVRNIRWKRHWRTTNEAYLVVHNWFEGVTIALPDTTNSKLAYCGRHPEQPIMAAMDRHLSSGGVFIDVGAHVGVYSLVAAKRVGASGTVIAIEPQSLGVSAMEFSASLNRFEHHRALQGALGAETCRMVMDSQSFGAVIAAPSSNDESGTSIPCWSLDDLAQKFHLDSIALLKLDAAGNEFSVLQGARRMIEERRLGAIVMKLYRPDVVRQRFGISSWDAVASLHEAGFAVRMSLRGKVLELKDPECLARIFADGSYCHIVEAIPR